MRIRAGLACTLSLLILGTAGTFTPKAPAGEPTPAQILGRRILAADEPLREVQAFTESRVPPMPEVRSVEEWERHADRMRRETLEKVVFRGEAATWRDAETRVEWLETLDAGSGYHIRKLRYEALPGLWIPALLYEPDQLEGRVPVVLNVNGHDRRHGKAADYKQVRCINQAKRGMLALNVEWVGMGQLATPGFDHYKLNQIDLCGTSGVAVHYLYMKRALDLLLAHPNADPQRVAVAGLSGGGWQTIFISALDLRVTLSNPVAGYSSFRTRARYLSDLGDSEQTPVDLATTADYAQLTAMRAPRPTLLTFNAEDNCCFAAPHALPPLIEAARPIFKLYGKDENLRSHVNFDPGTHNYLRDNREALYRMLGDHFFPDDATFDPTEIPCDDELLSQEELNVPLPADNADFHTLAVALAEKLPLQAEWPSGREEATAWQDARRKVLREIVRWPSYTVSSEPAGSTDLDNGAKAFYWRLKVNDLWTLPAVDLSPENASRTVILIADGGRSSVSDEAFRLMKSGARVVAVDPFYLGESKIAQRDFLYALLVSAVGERPLGVQAAQVAAVAGWLRKQGASQAVEIVAVGPRTGLIALVAAAMEPQAIAGLTLHDALGSLKQILERDWSVRQAPELFCFGLLEEFDVLQLAALVAPRPVRFAAPDERIRRELASLAGWYAQLGRPFDPLATGDD